MDLTFDELRALLSTLDATEIEEMTLKSNDFELTVRKAVPHKSLAVPQTTVIAPDATMASMHPSMAAPMMNVPVSAPAGAGAPPPSSNADSKLLEITSPMVGTFYRAPAPDEPPFVSVGDRITTGQTVCIIEAMKLMNELEAEFSGEVVEIVVDNADPVEFGQVLMRVKPV